MEQARLMAAGVDDAEWADLRQPDRADSGSAQSAVPRLTALAPAAKVSRASAGEPIPPPPMIGAPAPLAASAIAASAAGRTSGLVIAALRYLGKTNVTTARVERLRQVLSTEDRTRLLADLNHAPAWMHEHLRAIANPA